MCAACGRVAPVDEYVRCVRSLGGLLVVDDTQAIGVLGAGGDSELPYGHGGGGTLRHLGVAGSDVVVFVSLAKGFGAPVAVLVAAPALIAAFRERSETRVHCSPPALPVLLAAQRALAIDRSQGDVIRRRLATRVARFRHAIVGTGMLDSPGLFPILSLRMPTPRRAIAVHHALARYGIRTAMTRRHAGGTALTFVITAMHTDAEIDHATRMTLTLLRHTTRSAASPRPAFTNGSPRALT
jgi:8-amino-7-oxononanoate synthase